ncbi:MAG: cysteine desulfurase/selenocysteine lyase [Verrucomicrobiales bacterium]|jgi:cysteine desulfurase/selenocysteine lyase
MSDFDIAAVRAEFPILSQVRNEKPLVYLDNGATTQKPKVVVDAVCRFYSQQNANIHRGAYSLSVEATDLYDQARERVASFLNAATSREIIFTRGTTESINLVAATWGREHVKSGDEIVLTVMEHHANIVPWQVLAESAGATLKVVDISDEGVLDLEQYEEVLCERTRLVAFTHVSNVLGTTNPVKQMVQMAHAHGALTLIDGAQAVAHGQVDVRDIDCDFYAFSGHKLFAPDGIGVLYGRAELLDAMPPYQTGGDMIELVSFEKTTFRAAPERFEAGTPHISGAIGLAAAIDYLSTLDHAAIAAHEASLLELATNELLAIEGVRINGTAPGKQSVISFTLDCAHPHDIATILDSANVAVRAGHHCAQPLMKRLGVSSTARASVTIYNTSEEILALVAAVQRVVKLFA